MTPGHTIQHRECNAVAQEGRRPPDTPFRSSASSVYVVDPY